MDRVAAKVAQEVGVLLQDHDLDAGTRQKIAEHHPGGAAADDAALCTSALRLRRLHERRKLPP